MSLPMEQRITKFAKTKKMKLKLLIFSSLIAVGSYAQEGPYISDAIISLDKNNDVPEAYKFIEEAQSIIEGKSLSEVKAKNLQKYYYYQGLINLRIAQSQDPAIHGLNEMAVDDAVKFFQETLKYEKQLGKEKYTDESNYYLQECANLVFMRGAALSDAGNKAAAADAFLSVVELKQTLATPVLDTTSLYNAALLSEQAGESNTEYFNKAIALNEQLIALGYTGISWTVLDAESQQRVIAGSKASADRVIEQQPEKYSAPEATTPVTADLYRALVRLYKRTENKEKFQDVLKRGRAQFPNDDFFVKYELQEFLDNKDYESAMKNLDLAIQSDPSNPLFPYVKGVIQQTEMKNNEGAMASYDQALSINPDYFDALYMKGVLYVEKANAYTEEMNKLPLNANKKYNALKAEQKKVFEDALPYFEKAYAQRDQDADVLRALKEVYYKLEMNEKSMEMNKKLQDLPQE